MTEPASRSADPQLLSHSLPFLRLFRCFQSAIYPPPRLLVALLLVISVFLSGQLMDLIWGTSAHTGEFEQFIELGGGQAFDDWHAEQGKPTKGIFATAMAAEIDAFRRLVSATTSLSFGVEEFLPTQPHQPYSAVGALREMVVFLPAWLITTYPWFALTVGLAILAISSLLGGAIFRMLALDATCGQLIPATDAVHFAARRWTWFFVAPLLPVVFIIIVGFLLTVGGLLFNVWVGDVIAGLFFGLALLGGALIAISLIFLAAGVHLLWPAIAIEDTNAFDALSRSISYLGQRPWHWLFYSVVSLVYGAITYVIVGLVILLALWSARYFVSIGVFRTADGMPWLDIAMPAPELGQLAPQIQWQQLGFTGKLAAGLMAVWSYALIGLLGAYAITYYASAQTHIYLLLRKAVDGDDYDRVALPAPDEQPDTEPAPQADSPS